MLKYLVKEGHSLTFTARSSWEDEEAAMEKLMRIDDDAPKSLRTYQAFLVCPKVKVKPIDDDEDN